jgi:plastocyanin
MRRIILRSGAIFGIALAIAASLMLADEEASGQTTVNVDVGDIYFCDPSFANGVCETNVSVGDTVMWNWVGNQPHSVEQCDPAFATCPPPGGFDSGTMTGAGSTFSQTFNVPGSFEYQCDVHGSGMRGRVVIAGAQATPTATAGVTQPTQTSTAAPTASAAPAATATRTAAAATPAAVPGTGGGDADGELSWPLVLTGVGVLLVVSAGVGTAVLRRR